jgi:hypothetical protein
MFDNYLRTYEKETETTIRVFYTLKRFNEYLTNEDGVEKINKNVYFWMIFEASLVTRLFIGLRRQFEQDKPNRLTFQKFINKCEDNIHEFSKSSLEKRRLEGQSIRPDYLDDYLKGVYTPTIADFNKLAKIVRDNNKGIKQLYLDIGSKIFAHAIHTDNEVIKSMLSALSFDKVEASLKALWTVCIAVHNMYHNGMEPRTQLIEYFYIDEVYNCLQMQLDTAA